MDFEKLCMQVIEISHQVGEFILEQKNKISEQNIEAKGKNDFVTFVDKTSEQKLVDALEKILPESGFIAEENTSTKKGDVFNWIIDPLDGTTNFIHGLAPFAISIALVENQEIVLGVVHEMNLNETFYAWKGSKAFLNRREVQVSKTETVASSLIATGFPYYDYKRLDQFMESMKFFMNNSRGLRRLGSAATDLAYVACGRFDAFYEYSLKPWDVAAGAFIVQQAGGKISDFDKGQNWLYGQEIIAANSNSFNELQNIISEIMNA